MVEVVAYGFVVVFVLGLVPAFVVCVIREEWIALSAGFLTFGFGWWFGALRGESWRSRGNVTAALLCAALALGVLVARPVQFFGVDGHALTRSVGGWFGASMECRQVSAHNWSCRRTPGFYDEETDYRVRVDRLGCWHGVAEETRLLGPDRIEGCVNLGDIL